ncbi:glycerophosphodiester phosphodiesterase family protein [Plantibacter sp. YIM 135347]|uniref:glycerophosphodiester phosphodiesterase family protein n=1 Tax=Plantibacter sp. YIM 135347 TaxID=3423919 RepID=UPI003D340599
MTRHRTIRRSIAGALIGTLAALAGFAGGSAGATQPIGVSEPDRSGWCPTWQQQYEAQSNVIGVVLDSVVTVRHRGEFTAERPENSLAAFQRAYEYCRPAIETDVRATQDGELVAFHDANVGKMLEPSYDPLTLQGPNRPLSELTLAEIKAKRLVNTATRQATEHVVPTITELLEDYLARQGQSILVLDIKEGAIIASAAAIKDVAERHPGSELFKRVVLKMVSSEFPTPTEFFEALRRAGITEEVQVVPTMNPAIADRINDLPHNIPDVPGQSYESNATRAVAQWASQPGSRVPSVQVLVKDSSDFVHTETRPSPQGDFAAPVTLTPANTSPGTMAEMAMVVKINRKALAVFAPVPDYIMWRTDRLRDVSVPNVIAGKTETFPVTEAFYQNDSSCCYQLQDRLSQGETAHEFADVRLNLSWLRGVGFNVVTTDDADSIDTFYRAHGQLSTVTTPRVYPPPVAMNSRLSWDLGYVTIPESPKVKLMGWRGEWAGWWGGTVCLWNQKLDWGAPTYGWVYNCGNGTAQADGYTDRMITRVVGDGRMEIRSYKPGSYCLNSLASSDPSASGTADWLPCGIQSADERALWTMTREGRFRDQYGRYLSFTAGGALYGGLPYGETKVVPASEATDTWTQWALAPNP